MCSYCMSVSLVSIVVRMMEHLQRLISHLKSVFSDDICVNVMIIRNVLLIIISYYKTKYKRAKGDTDYR